VIAVVVVLLLAGGDDKKDSTTQASNTTTATASTPSTDTSSTFSMDTSDISTISTDITSETTTEDTSTDDSGGGGLTEYPPNVKEQFVSGCVKGGGSETQCTCTIDAIEAKYDLVEFLDLLQKTSSSGSLPKELQDIVTKCR
jgi:hypothetical protein